MGNIDRICFSIGSVNIYWYGLLMASGIIIAILLASVEAKRKKLYADVIVDLSLWIIPLGIIGARLYYVLFSWPTYASNPISVLYIWQGGIAMYGSLIGGMVGLLIFARRKKLRALKLLDCLAPGLVLAQAIGRWGNFFNQEAFGLPVTPEMLSQYPILQYFPFSVSIETTHSFNGVLCLNPIHLATFFYESAWCFLVFVALWLCRKKFKHDGDVFLTYGLLYSFERMFVEGLRGDSLYLVKPDTLTWLSDGIRVSQALSFAAFACIGLFFLLRASREKKLGHLIWPSVEATGEKEDGGEESVETEGAQEQSEREEEMREDEQDTDADDAEAPASCEEAAREE